MINCNECGGRLSKREKLLESHRSTQIEHSDDYSEYHKIAIELGHNSKCKVS